MCAERFQAIEGRMEGQARRIAALEGGAIARNEAPMEEGWRRLLQRTEEAEAMAKQKQDAIDQLKQAIATLDVQANQLRDQIAFHEKRADEAEARQKIGEQKYRDTHNAWCSLQELCIKNQSHIAYLEESLGRANLLVRKRKKTKKRKTK
jgi:chromosome segregation ATPase